MITSIAITNFKSIADLPPLQLGQQINFLIGKNGVGKSNLISAIELTRRLSSGQRFEDAAEQIAPFGVELFTKGLNTSAATIVLGLRDRDSHRYELSYTIGINDQDFAITNEKLIEIVGNEKREVYVRRPNSFTARKDTSSAPEEIPLAIKNDELALASYNDETVVKVAKLLSTFKVLWFDKSSAAYTWRSHRRDNLDRSNLDGLVVSLYENNRPAFNKAVSVIQQIIPEFTAPRISKISPHPAERKAEDESKVLDRFIVFWGEKETHEVEYTLTGLSDGNFRIIQLIFALFDSSASACLIGEEIENGQHYGRIKTLIEILKHLSIKLNIQLLFSTHSLELLGNVAPSDAIFCSKDSEGHSSYKKLNDEVNTSMVKEELGREPTAKELIDLGMI